MDVFEPSKRRKTRLGKIRSQRSRDGSDRFSMFPSALKKQKILGADLYDIVPSRDSHRSCLRSR